jgi:hypothetical protein
MALLLLGVWFVGYMVAVQLIYRALMRGRTAEMSRKGKRMTAGDTVSAAVGASILALIWPVMTPFFVGRAAMTGSPKIVIQDEIERYRDDHAHETRIRQQLAAGKHDIEVASRETPSNWR